MLPALRRLTVLLVAIALGVGLAAGLLGVAAGSSFARAVSLGYYVVGAFLIVLGFFAGNRGPLRPRSTGENEPIAGLLGIGLALRGARRVSPGEQQDTLATAGIFLAVGFWLILLGVAVDTSVEVV